MEYRIRRILCTCCCNAHDFRGNSAIAHAYCILSCYREESEWTLAVDAMDIWGEEPRENRKLIECRLLMDTKWDADDSKKGEFRKLRSIQNGRTIRHVFGRRIFLCIQWGVDIGENRPMTVKEIIRRVTESIFRISSLCRRRNRNCYIEIITTICPKKSLEN